MTNTISVWTGGIIIAAIILDQIFNSGDALFFMAKKGDEFSEWLAFWR